MQLKIQIQNADRILGALRAAPGVAAVEFDKALSETVVYVQQQAMQHAPVGKGYKGGGSLRQSIMTRRLGFASHQVIVNAEYGVYVDQGTRPHVIYPKQAKMLAFQKNGGWIFAKRVNHPGTKAQPFFTNAVKAGEVYANDALSKAADRIFNTF